MAAPQEPWWLPHGTPGLVSVGGNQGWGRNSLAPVQRRSGGFRGGAPARQNVPAEAFPVLVAVPYCSVWVRL